MINQLTRMAVIAMAFGFLYACSPVDHLQQATSQKNNEQYKSALESSRRAIENNPDNPEVHILKAEILSEYIKTLDASERTELYDEMIQSVETSLAIAQPAGTRNIESRALQLRSGSFNFEYESALSYLSVETDDLDSASLLPALPHLENASIIQPGYEDIYESMVHVYSSNRMYDEAISTMSKLQESSEFDLRRHEIMGFLYYQSNKFESAIEHLLIAWENGRGTPNSGRGLANALRKMGDSMSEREVLEQLTEIEPENLYNHLALGKNLMEEVFLAIESLRDESEKELIQEQMEQSLADAGRIEGYFDRALQISQNHILTNLTSGLYYRNFAFLLRSVQDDDVALLDEDELESKTQDYFYKSLIHLEKASELDPDQPLVWHALWPVYDALGMVSQANEARARVNENP